MSTERNRYIPRRDFTQIKDRDCDEVRLDLTEGQSATPRIVAAGIGLSVALDDDIVKNARLYLGPTQISQTLPSHMKNKMQSISKARTIRPGFFRRPFSSRTAISSSFRPGPAPPRLPKEEQEMFEKLQQQSTGAFSTPRELQAEAEKKDAEAEEAIDMLGGQSRSASAEKMLEQLRERARVVAKGDGEELHPNVRRGSAPEFEGDTNPKTGEVGGPKNDPLRWGVESDWSYNGRVTDF